MYHHSAVVLQCIGIFCIVAAMATNSQANESTTHPKYSKHLTQRRMRLKLLFHHFSCVHHVCSSDVGCVFNKENECSSKKRVLILQFFRNVMCELCYCGSHRWQNVLQIKRINCRAFAFFFDSYRKVNFSQWWCTLFVCMILIIMAIGFASCKKCECINMIHAPMISSLFWI